MRASCMVTRTLFLCCFRGERMLEQVALLTARECRRSLEDAFRIGGEIAGSVTAANPAPVLLRMEKVYHPCFMVSKKRYVGLSYEAPGPPESAHLDCKGIEIVRRDSCPVVGKVMEKCIRMLFAKKDLSAVKAYLQRSWTKMLAGRLSLADYVFAKEVRLGSYKPGATLPPAAEVATRMMMEDPRSEPRCA